MGFSPAPAPDPVRPYPRVAASTRLGTRSLQRDKRLPACQRASRQIAWMSTVNAGKVFMFVKIFPLSLALAGASFAASASAGTIFEHFPDTFNNVGAIANDVMRREILVNFSPSTDVQVRSIRWLGDYSASTDSFRISFYENPNPSTAPVWPAFFSETSTADTVDPKPYDFGWAPPVVFEAIYGEDLGAGITLLGGRNYQISISAISTGQYAWKAASLYCCAISRDIDTGEAWRFSIEPGFGLYSDSLVGSVVPEPMSWAMMIAGFGLVGARLRAKAVARAR